MIKDEIDTTEILTVADLMLILKDLPSSCMITMELINTHDGNKMLRCPVYSVSSMKSWGKKEDDEYVLISGIKE